MECCAVQHNQKPDRGNSGESSDCTATLSGLIGDNMAYIGLSREKVALVDDGMWDWLSHWKWYAGKLSANSYYAMRTDSDRKTILMHRLILNAKQGEITDHINNDGLDNRSCNLRICNASQNCQNVQKRKGCISKYKGAYWIGGLKKWQSQITYNRRRLALGYYETEIEAAKAYDIKALELYGEYAYLNFPRWNYE